MAHLRRFFRAAVQCLTSAYDNLATAQVLDSIRPSLCDRMRQEIADNTEEFDPSKDQASGSNTPVGDTTPVENTEQSFPGCAGVRSVGGATMPFALSQGGCFKCINCQLGATDICWATATWPVNLSYPQLRTSVANCGPWRGTGSRTPGSGCSLPEHSRFHLLSWPACSAPCRLCGCLGRHRSADVGEDISPVARWHPVGTGRDQTWPVITWNIWTVDFGTRQKLELFVCLPSPLLFLDVILRPGRNDH